jgi:uncharacterized protein (TIGR02453 family)
MADATLAERFEGFPPEAFGFFRKLANNNNREWFHAHKDEYERACREPMKLLLAELGAKPGSTRISRINRDLRFSRDKSPYRKYIAAGMDRYYISLSPAGLYVGTGLYKPEPPALDRLRKAIDRDVSGRALERIVGTLQRKGYTVDTHERLASVPRGYAADHARIELLRMKGFFAGKTFGPEAWLSTRKALPRIRKALNDIGPLAEWLRLHVGARSS